MSTSDLPDGASTGELVERQGRLLVPASDDAPPITDEDVRILREAGRR